MKSFKEHLSDNNQPVQESTEVNEILMELTCIMLVSYAVAPFIKSTAQTTKDVAKDFADFFKDVGSGIGSIFGGIFGGLKNMFSSGKNDDKEDKDEKEENKDKKTDGTEGTEQQTATQQDTQLEQQHGIFESILGMAKEKINGNDKNAQQQKQTIETLQAATVGKDGKPLPPNKWDDRMQQVSGQSIKDFTAANNIQQLSKEDLEKVQKATLEELKKRSEEDLRQLAEKETQTAAQQSKAVTAYQNKEAELQKEIEDAGKNGDEGKFKKAMNKLNELCKKATGACTSAAKKTGEWISTTAKSVKDKITKKKEGEDGEPEGTTAKEEEITDKETGQKVKRKVYTGPQGGRYYYPDDAPHDADHKVYVEHLNEFLNRVL